MLASCALDVKFHDWDTGDCYGTVHPPDPNHKGFLDITWCNQGKNIICVPVQGKCINAAISKLSQENERFCKPYKEVIDIHGVRCASFSRIETCNVVLGTYTGDILLYNTQAMKVLQKYSELPAAINLVETGAQDMFIAAGCNNGQIYVYGSEHAVSAAYFVPDSELLTALAVHKRIPHLLAGGSEQGVAAIWDINSGNCCLKAPNHFGAILDMAFSNTDDLFTTIGADKKINIYDLRTSECVHAKQFDTDLTTLAYCPNGTDIAVGTGRGQIICLDKRYLHSSKLGLKVQQCPVKKISFDTSNYAQRSMHKLDEEGVQMPATYNFNKPNECGDRSSPNKTKLNSLASSECNMNNSIDRSTFHIIDEHSLNQLRDDIMKSTKQIVNTLVEKMNNEFLKIRMGVSREFCTMEINNKRRWQEFNMILLKIADLDESESPELAVNSLRERQTNSSKIKMTSSTQFLVRNSSSKSVK